jgi:hypothetical protein
VDWYGKKVAYPSSEQTHNWPEPGKEHAVLELTANDHKGTVPKVAQTLDELAREGARRMIAGALELGVEEQRCEVNAPRRVALVCAGAPFRGGKQVAHQVSQPEPLLHNVPERIAA